MGFRDFFYFNRAERNGILVLLGILVLVLMAGTAYRAFYKVPIYDFSEFTAAADDFKQRLAEIRLAEEAERSNRRLARRTATTETATSITLTVAESFNPNNLPIETWKQMGLPPRLAQTIKNFENAGGSFRFKEDVSRVFGMTDQIYAQLEPHLQLPSRSTTAEIPASLSRFAENAPNRPAAQNVMVNLNTADTLELITLRGIGPSFSRRIVNYRERLGGFHSTNQLLEVFGMDSTRLAGFKQNLLIDTTYIRRININNAEWTDLVRHPYIDRNIANSIIAIRRQHGAFTRADQIMKSHLITQEVFNKLAPYITVSD
ncbi:MAG TPA: hypothetical protein DCM62_04835 [Bacteroidales bacterium]|nr:hypothetical protein [Bacteroidales bacterium]